MGRLVAMLRYRNRTYELSMQPLQVLVDDNPEEQVEAVPTLVPGTAQLIIKLLKFDWLLEGTQLSCTKLLLQLVAPLAGVARDAKAFRAVLSLRSINLPNP